MCDQEGRESVGAVGTQERHAATHDDGNGRAGCRARATASALEIEAEGATSKWRTKLPWPRAMVIDE